MDVGKGKSKPEAKICPVCDKPVGISKHSLQAHLRRHHPEQIEAAEVRPT